MTGRTRTSFILVLALVAFLPVACADPPAPDQVVALGGAFNTNCAVYGSGRVACWGDLPGTGTSSDTPTTISGLRAVSRITHGEGSAGHVCVLVTGGSVSCWGRNSNGQLGPAVPSISSATPVQVIGLPNASDIAAGGDHSCAVATVGGAVSCWGSNSFGELGNGTTTDSQAPVQVLGITRAINVVAGRNYSCALVVGGNVFCWGAGPVGNDRVPPTGTSSPVPVITGDFNNQVLLLEGVAHIAGGDSHVCVTIGEVSGTTGTTGTVDCWGDGTYGQLGDGQSGLGASSALPVSVVGMVGATDLSAGADHTCAVSSQFTSLPDGLSCWGRSPLNGQAADSSVPLYANAQFVRALHAGSNSSCVVGQLDLVNPPSQQTGTGCWGKNIRGQLGNPAVVLNAPSVAPVRVQGI